jgi:hypothetical protein
MKTRVLGAAGPWHQNGNWWEGGEQWRREEWELALQGDKVSGLFHVFRELPSGEWFVEGMYD